MGSLTFNTWNMSIFLVGYVISVFGGHLIIQPVIDRLWKRYIPRTHERYGALVKYLGFIERILYTTAIMVGAKEFVAVWLAIKLAGQWTPTKTGVDRPLYLISLIGNGLSLIISVGMALLMQFLFV